LLRLNVDHARIELREALLFANLLADVLNSSSHLINVSAFFVVRGIDLVAVLCQVLKVPVSQLHIVASCDGIICSHRSLNHIGILSRDDNFSASIFRFICLLDQSVSILGGLEEFVV
jgi:hypothetical protein